MEAIIALLLVISTLTACAGKAPDQSQSSEELAPLQETSFCRSGTGILRYRVETAVYEDAVVADDGTELATCRFEYPVMTVCWPDGTPLEKAQTSAEKQALAAMETFNDQFGPTSLEEEFQTMADTARRIGISGRNPVGNGPRPMHGAGQRGLPDRPDGQYFCHLLQLYRRFPSQHGTAGLELRSDHRPVFYAGAAGNRRQGVFPAVQEELVSQSRLVAAENEMPSESFSGPIMRNSFHLEQLRRLL